MRPAISLEVGDPEDSEGSSRKVLDYLASKGYRPFEYRDGRTVPHALKERYGYDNLVFKPATNGESRMTNQ